MVFIGFLGSAKSIYLPTYLSSHQSLEVNDKPLVLSFTLSPQKLRKKLFQPSRSSSSFIQSTGLPSNLDLGTIW